MRNSILLIRYAIIAAFALLFAGCMDDGESSDGTGSEGETTPSTRYILFGSPYTATGQSWQNGRLSSLKANDYSALGALLRASSSASDVESETPEDLGVFAFGDGQNTTYIFKNQKVYFYYGQEFFSNPATGAPTNGLFSWNYFVDNAEGTPELNAWPYTTDPSEQASVQQPWEKMRYRFFAYSPWYPSNVSVGAENYSGFNYFTWDNIPGFSDKDFVLSNEIHNIDNRDGSRTTPDKVTFAMRHILSRIRFFFKMSSEYRKLRKIEINSITILTAGKVKTATFNFTDGISWDGTVHWSNEQPGTADPVTLINSIPDPLNPQQNISNPNYEVKTAYPAEPYSSVYVYPQAGFKELKMQINYSVYDSKGVKTREATVVNTIAIKTADDKGWTLLSGYYYDIYINIVPSYLYVLSDNDKVYDGAVIIKDE